jgi:hypothetical protein
VLKRRPVRKILYTLIVVLVGSTGALSEAAEKCDSPLWHQIRNDLTKGMSRDAVERYLNTLDGVEIYIARDAAYHLGLGEVHVDSAHKSGSEGPSPEYQPPGVEKYALDIPAAGKEKTPGENDKTPGGKYVIHIPRKSRAFFIKVEHIVSVSFDENATVSDVTCFVGLTGP